MNERLARKAHEHWTKWGGSYSDAVDAAFNELNPERNSEIAADLFGIPFEGILKRHQEGVVQPPADIL